MTELTQFVQAAQQGDRAAFGQIVTHFQDMAFAGAYAVLGDPHAAQDAAQEAFLEAYRNLGKLREPAAFPGWFRRIVLGRSHRELRQQPPTVVPLERVDLLYSDLHNLHEHADPAQQLDSWQLRDELTAALAALPEAQRLVVLLYHTEGYAYQEIAAFLEVPLSTVKKRLFDARRKIQGRMLHMVQDKLQRTKPSQDANFAQQVEFFLAFRAEDLATIKRLVTENPALLTAKTEWKMALGLHHWPIGSTALHLAASMGSTGLVAYLLTQSADVAAKNRSGMTPLHMAAIMGATDSVQLLLDHNADPNALSPSGQTPLHHAVLRNNLAITKLLLQGGSDPTIQDEQNRTAVDWAVVRQNSQMVDLLVAHGATPPADFAVASATPAVPAGQHLTGAPTDLLGAILTSSGSVRTPSRQGDVGHSSVGKTLIPVATSPILHTGLKFVDLLTPLVRGGQNGIFTPLSGVGFVVVIGQIIYSLGARPNKQGCTVWLIQESDLHRAEEQKLNLRESGIDEEIVYVTSAHQASAAAQRQTVETGLRIANQFQQDGWEVLLLVDSQLAEVEKVLPSLRTDSSIGPNAAVTTLVNGHHTPGALPAIYSGLDAVLAFDYTRAINRLYPALDPVRSHSTLLDRGLVSPIHRQVAAEVKRLLQRYGELRAPMEQHKLTTDDLWYIEDDPNLAVEINRARRLDRFLTQPFYGAEPYTGIVGQLVGLEETIAGCQAIINGEYDEVPEEAFLYVGEIVEVMAKAAPPR
jgi:RNA polymerase sigma factor (sigma-70 family)